MGVIEKERDRIIREGNHLIAIFDGYVFDPNLMLHNVQGAYTKAQKKPMLLDWFDYNKSWDAIMPVCKKFCSMDPNLFEFERQYRIRRDDLNERVTRYDINVVYPVLRDNIKWYNEKVWAVEKVWAAPVMHEEAGLMPDPGKIRPLKTGDRVEVSLVSGRRSILKCGVFMKYTNWRKPERVRVLLDGNKNSQLVEVENVRKLEI